MRKTIDRATATSMTEEEIDRLPESFQIEYLNGQLLSEQLGQMGAVFRHAEPLGDNAVRTVGEMPDGTEVIIEVRKGNKYQSPQERIRALQAEMDREKKNHVSEGRDNLRKV